MAATESNPIILYDITSALEDRAWSPNTWKARFVLNYKRLPYRTVWLSLPEIAPTLNQLGLEPLSTKPAYSLPVISDPSPPESGRPPTIVRDSAAIGQYLDVTYPDPERLLFPGGSHALQALFVHHISANIIPLFRSIMIPVTPSILDKNSLPYYYRTREAALGKPLAEAQLKGVELEDEWNKVKEQFGVLDSFLRNNDTQLGGVGGDLVLGNQYSFADFVLAGLFVWMSKFTELETGRSPWDRVRGWHDGKWERLWVKCEEFTQIK